MERASPIALALDPDGPVHQCDELRTDRQSKSRAAELSRGGTICLAERFEDGALLLGGDADSRVLDGDVQGQMVGCDRFDGRVDPHVSLLRELDGVADQVQEDLTQSARVAGQNGWNVGGNAQQQLQVLFGRPGRERTKRIGDQIAKVEVDPLEFQFAGLDLREVEDVVDQAQQGICRLLDQVEIVRCSVDVRCVASANSVIP